ncbi:MAG: hypothetical protein DWQ31_05535 [Planctomycetota bacterium]|nr:MAG: hypothetical protein DWQ31_05535 [Planctomycetota bacterium]REJ92974.1 MAG: hypothetical protein DWQ35_11085 [Planctomycetota bacterium]REK30584.1 MAG: hypothetical protein DWQ42_01715 [Planctomycetota bacterium]REK46008.1 MAG: hypothetical protein DWQ46_07545 [Planctomycetota bacterium]
MEDPAEPPGVDPDSERPPILPEMPQRPERPPSLDAPRAAAPTSRPLLTIGGSLVGLVLLSVILLLCTAGNPIAFLVAGGIFGFAALHYMIWGWWLGRMIHEEETAKHDEAQQPSGRA